MENMYWMWLRFKDWTYLDPRKVYLDDDIDENKVFVSNDPRIDNVWEYYLTREQCDIVTFGWTVLVDKNQAVKWNTNTNT